MILLCLSEVTLFSSGLPGVQSRSSLAEMSTPTPTPTPTPTLTPAEKKAEMVQTSLVRPQGERSVTQMSIECHVSPKSC